MDKILMFSTGLDSFILKTLGDFRNTECLFVQMGTAENEQEENIIDMYFPGVIKSKLSISQFELSNKIIPFRNHFFALLGAQYSTNIYFAFTAGDTTRDKDFVYKAQMEGLLNYFGDIPEKSPFPGKHYSIHIPLKDMTKTELVAQYIKEGHNPDNLINISKSCYNGTERACGQCRSCLRKFIALTLNGIECRKTFEKISMEKLNEFYKECKFKNRKQETEEVYKCIKQLKQ